MYYEINVAKRCDGDYRHVFATAERSGPSEYALKQMLKEIKPKFPEPEYLITVTVWDKVGHQIDIKEIL